MSEQNDREDYNDELRAKADWDEAHETWECGNCGHHHQGRAYGGICIGCPCPNTAPSVKDAWVRPK